MSHWSSAAVASVFIWLGMVLAISFLEAPLKFRAPGVTIQLGLGIGRLVFRALNTSEAMLAVITLAALAVGGASTGVWVAVAVAVVALAVQVVGVRPALSRRSDAVLADDRQAQSGRSRAHYYYVGFEVVKVVGLLVGGILLLNP